MNQAQTPNAHEGNPGHFAAPEPVHIDTVQIYTDGGCIGNPGPGGWAAILRYGKHRRELSGRLRDTTNNRMELRAAIEGLAALKRPCAVALYTDSEYLRQGITQWVHRWQANGWKTTSKQPVKNRDLWQKLLAEVERHAPAGGVEWRWLKGHAGHAENERADELANRAARSVTDADPADEPPNGGTEKGITRAQYAIPLKGEVTGIDESDVVRKAMNNENGT